MGQIDNDNVATLIWFKNVFSQTTLAYIQNTNHFHMLGVRGGAARQCVLFEDRVYFSANFSCLCSLRYAFQPNSKLCVPSGYTISRFLIVFFAYIPTVPLSAGQSRFRTICPAVPLSVDLSRSRPYEKMLKKLSASIQNSYKIFSLNNDQINITSSIFYPLFIVNVSQKVHTSVCLSNIILLSLMPNTSFN